MATKKIKEIYNLKDSPLLFDKTMTYPTIEGNTSNFLEYYDDHCEEFDNYFVKTYGNRLVDFDSEEDADIVNEWTDWLFSIQRIYLDSWARLFYALNIDFNPIYNVEEHTETIYGEDITTADIGERERGSTFGSKQNTLGTRSDTSTAFSTSYDTATEKETGKQTDEIGQQINTEGSHTDTHTEEAAHDVTTRAEHTDVINRSGNIGVVSATELLEKEERLRRNYSFYKNCFLTIINEVGAYFDTPDCFR